MFDLSLAGCLDLDKQLFDCAVVLRQDLIDAYLISSLTATLECRRLGAMPFQRCSPIPVPTCAGLGLQSQRSYGSVRPVHSQHGFKRRCPLDLSRYLLMLYDFVLKTIFNPRRCRFRPGAFELVPPLHDDSLPISVPIAVIPPASRLCAVRRSLSFREAPGIEDCCRGWKFLVARWN